jgi:hypothetical protein
MGGIIGGSSAKTDRGNQLAATQADWNLFSYGLPQGQQGQSTGQADLNAAKNTLGPATDYWTKQLSAGRQQTAQNSAPAINQELANKTATRNAEGTFGTDRTGGTVAANREASSQTGSKVDDIINSTLLMGRESGAKGLQSAAGVQAGIASTELGNALSLLGLSSDSVNSILQNSTSSRQISQKIHDQEVSGFGSAIGQILLAAGLGA